MPATNFTLFATPCLRDGVVHRGVIGVDRPHMISQDLNRDLWAVLVFLHGPVVPHPTPEVDLYTTSHTFASICPQPALYLTARDLIDENVFFPTGIAKQYDVVFNGNWMPAKRHELLIDALALSKLKGRELSCLWFGYHFDARWHNRDMMLRREVAFRGISVDFAETNFDPIEVNRRYNLSRCAINCSDFEAGPRTMGEATLADIPFIATSNTNGGCPQTLDSSAGIVCDGTAEGICQAIWDALDQRERFEPRKWALENLCVSVANRKLRAAILKLAEKTGYRINHDDVRFHGYDWGGGKGWVKQHEQAILGAASTP